MAISVGNILPRIPDFNFALDPTRYAGNALKSVWLIYMLEMALLLLLAFIVFKLYRMPFRVIIIEKIGNGLKWKRADYGRWTQENGIDRLDLFLSKKKIDFIPDKKHLIMRNKRSNTLILLEKAPNEYVQIGISDTLNSLEPIPHEEKVTFALNQQLAIQKKLDAKSDLLGKHPVLFNLAVWGIIGLLIISVTTMQASKMISTAATSSSQVMRDSNAQAAKAAGQIASALTTINVGGKTIPTPLPPT